MRRTLADNRSRLFSAAWLLIAAALCVALATWGVSLGRELGPIALATPPVVAPPSTAAPNIVTDYTQDGTQTTQSLCAEISPAPSSVIVESPTGTVISRANCPSPGRNATGSSLDGGALSPAPSSLAESCEFVRNDDGTVVVMSAKTGSLLSEAQAANCTK